MLSDVKYGGKFVSCRFCIEMILLFHTLCIVTRCILTVISKSIFSKAEDVSGEQETNSYFILNIDITSEAEFEPGLGIRFFPPVYVQRYLAVKNILQDERWHGKIKKVVDFGCGEFGLFPYIKHIPGLQELMTIDIDREMLDYYCCRAAPLKADYLDNRQEPLTVHVFAGSIADKDPRLLGTDAVICIELIEHLYPDTLEAVPHTVFGFIQPLISIFTTPNLDFNVLFPNFTGFRHPDHKFEWSRVQFEDWATNITTRYPAYTVKFCGVGQGPKGTEEHGCCSQMAVFVKLSHYTPTPLIHLASHHQDLEVEECEETYLTVRKYDYPFYIDNRTNEEKILHEAEYYIRVLASNEKYCSDMSIRIPLRHLLPHVDICDSTSELRNILEDAGWQVTGQLQDDVAVVYPYYGEYESSTHESEFLYREEQEEGMANEQVQVADYKEENWDVSEFHEYDDNVTSHFVEGVDDWSCGIIEPQCDMQLEWAGRTELQDVIGNSSDSCKTRKDELMECSGCIRNGKCEISVSDGGHLSAKNSEELIQSTLQHSHDFSAALNSKDNTDIRSLADLEPELSAEQTFTPFVGHSASKEGFEFSEIIQNCKSVNAVNVESQKFDLDFEKYSNSEALTDHKSQKHKKMGDILCPCSESRKVIGKLQNSQHVELQASQLKSSNVNLSSQYSSSNRNTEKLIVCQVLHAEESLSAELLNLHLKQETVDGSTSQAVIGQPLNFCSASSSVQESSQERSLVESCSVDEQNDKAVDSGYPNSFSVQDMDMDLTPEQVDEISTESDEILTENSEDSEYYESESSEERDHIDNNDGLLFQHHHQALYDPMVLVVENGDVANNNRDGEGNNAVAIIQPPQEPVEALDPADDLIPLLAAAEDFDNDNDIILPDDIEPFPHWLLHLLGLANPGGGDIQNYIVLPVGDGGFLLPDEGLGDIDDNDDIDASSSSSSEVSDNEGVLNDLDNNELVVLADMEEGENQVHSKVVYRLS